MACERELPETFSQGCLRLAKATVAAAKVPASPESDILNQENYQSWRAHPNPQKEELEKLFLAPYEDKKLPEAAFWYLPWTRKIVSKGEILRTLIAFSDQHDLPLSRQVLAPGVAREFVEEVINKAESQNRQITLDEQFEIARKLSGNMVLGAALIAHSGSRAIARDSDRRADQTLNFTPYEMRVWRDCVSFFPSAKDVYGDPAGDTYHFWYGMVFGIISETKLKDRDLFLNQVYKLMCQGSGQATDLLRYKLCGFKGGLHVEADKLGFEIGKTLKRSLT